MKKDHSTRKKVKKATPSSIDWAEMPNTDIISKTDKNGATIMKSNVDVGRRALPVIKEEKEPSNAQMK